MPLIVSVMGTSHDQFARLVEGVGGREEVAAIELNVSCPNVKSGLIVGESPDEARSLLETVRPLTEKPLLVKLTPNVADPVPVAEAAVEGGADAVSLINTLRAIRDSPPRPESPGLAEGPAASPARPSGRSRWRRSARLRRRSPSRWSRWAASRPDGTPQR